MKLIYTLHAAQQAKARRCPIFSTLPGRAQRISAPGTQILLQSDDGGLCESVRYSIKKARRYYCLVLAGRKVLTTFPLDAPGAEGHEDVIASRSRFAYEQRESRRREAAERAAADAPDDDDEDSGEGSRDEGSVEGGSADALWCA